VTEVPAIPREQVWSNVKARELADEQVTAEVAKDRRRKGDAPRRVQRSVGDQTPHKIAVRIKYADESIAWSGVLIPVRRHLGVLHVKISSQHLDIKRRIARSVGSVKLPSSAVGAKFESYTSMWPVLKLAA
jgi:hypothetical protein